MKPKTKIYLAIGTAIIIGGGIAIYVWRKKSNATDSGSHVLGTSSSGNNTATTSTSDSSNQFPLTGIVKPQPGTSTWHGYNGGDTLSYRYNPSAAGGHGGYEFYDKGTQHLSGISKDSINLWIIPNS